MEQINSSTIKIGGVTIEAVRFKAPIPHWRPKLPNGVILECGVFKGDSRPKMFDDIEYFFNRICKRNSEELKRQLKLD